MELCKEKPEQIFGIYKSIIAQGHQEPEAVQLSLFSQGIRNVQRDSIDISPKNLRVLTMPKHHSIKSSVYLNKILFKLYERPPEDYKNLLQIPGVGPSTLRALAMVAEVTTGPYQVFKIQ